MLTKDCKIQNKLGLHARAASKLVNTASRFSADVTLHKENMSANAKSIMSLMMLAATKDTPIHLTAKGEDAEVALNTIYELITNKFDEAE